MKKTITIAGQEIEVEAIQTGLIGDPFDGESVVPAHHALNRLVLEDLPACKFHPDWRGFKAPNWPCGQCWTAWGRILHNDYARRAARRRQ